MSPGFSRKLRGPQVASPTPEMAIFAIKGGVVGRPLRMFGEDEIYFVTARTVQGRMLLRPSTETNEFVGGVLAQAVSRSPVELYGYVVASNHVHLLLRARDGALSEFMKYLLGNLAKKVGRIVGWSGPFWDRRYSAEPVLDDEAVLGRLKYILAHGVKEGLVRRVQDWPGLSCASQVLNSAARRFRWFHWARRWQQNKLAPKAPGLMASEIAEDVLLELTPIPSWARLPASEREAAARMLISEIEHEGARKHVSVLGVKAICRQHPQRRPGKLKKSPRPACHASSIERWKKWKQRYREFAAAYRAASGEFLLGNWAVEFPAFAFRPPCHRHVRV